MEHQDPWLNNGTLDEIEGAKGKKQQEEKDKHQAQEQKVNVCEWGDGKCVRTYQTHTGREEVQSERKGKYEILRQVSRKQQKTIAA